MDEIERNDESFIFIVEAEGATLKRLMMYPTMIENCQACMGKDERAEIISTKMKKLCQELRTEAVWNRKEIHLEVVLS